MVLVCSRFCDICIAGGALAKELEASGASIASGPNSCPKFGAAIQPGKSFPASCYHFLYNDYHWGINYVHKRRDLLTPIHSPSAALPDAEYPFLLRGLCTPRSAEMERSLERELGSAWREVVRFASRGDLQIHMHIMDRANPPPRPCLQLGAGVFQYRGPAAFRTSMERRLRQKCRAYEVQPRIQGTTNNSSL